MRTVSVIRRVLSVGPLALATVLFALAGEGGAADSGRDVCGGLPRRVHAVCEAYCVKYNCPGNFGSTCEALRKTFAKKTGTSAFPCDVPGPTLTPTPEATPTRTVAVTPVATATATAAPTCTPTPTATPTVQVYTYDFETGTADWSLQADVWSWAALDGGYALRSTGQGFAGLTAHTGEVSSLGFRVRLDDLQAQIHANVRESWPNGLHTRYIAWFSTGGVRISRQQSGSMQLLGTALVPIAPRVLHDVRIIVGAGSVDVFVDGEGVLGVDDPNELPAGRVSFEGLGSLIAYVDDVEVRIGAEPTPHERAPRPVSSMPPGPDVGRFVAGTYTGNYTISSGTTLTLSQGRYTLVEGTITVPDNARMRIEEGAVLIFDRGTSPLLHWGFDLRGTGSLEIKGGGSWQTTAWFGSMPSEAPPSRSGVPSRGSTSSMPASSPQWRSPTAAS